MMSSAATLTLPTRPKIHRLPGVLAAEKKGPVRTPHAPKSMRIDFTKLYVGAAGLLVVVGMGVGLFAHPGEVTDKTPEALEALTVAPSGSSDESLLVAAVKAPSDTIIIKGERGGIVGQMARIPSPNVQITEVQGVSNVDKSSGRELLSIVNKY